MSKEEKTTTEEIKEVTKTDKLPKVKEMESWSEDDLVKALDAAEQGQELTAEYLGVEKFEEGEEKRFIFQGKARMTPMEDAKNVGPDGKVPAVKFYGSDKKMYITAATVIVSSCDELNINDPVSITFKGWAGSKKKEYADFKVTKLVFKS